jgi:hypothetical protein
MPEFFHVLHPEKVFQRSEPGLPLLSGTELLEGPLAERSLGVLERNHTFFNAVFHKESHNPYGSFLANAMHAIHCLQRRERVATSGRYEYKNPFDRSLDFLFKREKIRKALPGLLLLGSTSSPS